MRLLSSDINPFETGERFRVKPSAICQQRVAPHISNRRFQMQAAGHGNADDLIAIRREDGRKLPNALGIGATRKPGEQPSLDTEKIATLDLARQFHASKFAKFGKRLRDRSRFRPPLLRS